MISDCSHLKKSEGSKVCKALSVSLQVILYLEDKMFLSGGQLESETKGHK